MKFTTPAILVFALSFFPSLPAAVPPAGSPPGVATTPPPAPESALDAAMKALIPKIQAKTAAGKPTEETLAPELKELDAIADKYKADKTQDVSQVLFLKARIYAELLDNNEKALEVMQQIKTQLPNSEVGQHADEIIKSVQQSVAREAAGKSLVAGAVFPPIDEKDLAGQALSTSKYKGKIVLVDFWATWCGPCVQELPNVLDAYQKYHDKGFEIVGISLDKDRESLTKFVKERSMPWSQYFDGQSWEGKLPAQYGIKAIPATFLLDREGKILARDLRGPELEKELEKQLK